MKNAGLRRPIGWDKAAHEMAKDMKTTPTRTKEQIFFDMHRELRAWNPEVPESPERLDPILRLLLQLYASQLARIDVRIGMVWEVAINSLIRSVCPESMRWPVPAFTVMRCEPTDPVVTVDPHTKFFYKEKREGGQTFFFSALRHERLIAASVRRLYLQADKTIIDLSPQAGEALSATSRPRMAFAAGGTYRVYIGVDHNGPADDFTDATVFLNGMPEVLKQLRWAYWYPGSHFGGFYEDCGFCPGLITSLDGMFTTGARPAGWGGLRTDTDLFKPLEDSFVVLPERFTGTWELGTPDPSLIELLSHSGADLPPDSERLYWIRLDLPAGGDKSRLQSLFTLYFNCFIAVNKNELTLFKHTGGNRIVEVELPENIAAILEVTGVVDSGGREYVARHLAAGGDAPQRYYTSEERDDKLVLWFDFSSALELPPDSLTINYAVTAGTDANGIEAGRVTDLYESHPGIHSAVNIIPVSGAVPAKTEPQVITEVAARLRNRDRALSFPDIVKWTTAFDPRIKLAQCENGVERAARGVRRCTVVGVTIKDNEFHSDDEVRLLQTRLQHFLKSRSPVNTHYRVEMHKI
jgi:hypothetical protein